MNAISLDATDCRILTVLQQEGRISNLDLAERISLSPSACLRRLRLLEEQGVIERYRACLNREVLGFELEAFVQVSMRNDQQNWHETFAEALRDWPEVVGAFVVTGETHYLLRVLAHNLKHYSDFVLQRLYKAPGVMDIRSNIVLQTLKEDSGVPVTLVPGATAGSGAGSAVGSSPAVATGGGSGVSGSSASANSNGSGSA
jgi:Lrp/AsnC family transcriptional regulator, leucine-responsive regulatory protein